ncbi:hypothetical protein LQ318_03680 [Aliifodinibius salicampi]|uniref:DUF937 domain-containing protein n=1 Tax=Fodinibius salicampi TaxID=1920655 RepID=A0ABT3PVY7_9BACT|nr:hypothetical protein [Fodinibius salicampi]MCW9711996.1 hypothetical protein [Fodinibius salicampi]
MKNSKLLFLSLFVCSMCLWLWPLEKVHAQNTDLSVLVERAEAAGMEQVTLSELQNRAQSQGISNEQLGQILKSALSLSEQNLPGQLAIEKALEGLSKGVPGERLIPAVNRIGQGMRQAAEVVDPWMGRNEVQGLLKQSGQSMSENGFRNEMIKATSKSFVQNVPSDNVQSIFHEIGSEEIISRSTPGDLITAVSILPDLPTTANQPKVSASFIVRALKGGFDADKLQQLPSAMKMGQQRSQLPAASIIEGVAQQMDNGTPAKQVLQNLFNGNIGGGPPGNIPKGLENRPDRGNNNRGNGNPGGNNGNN